ncbi:peptidyl-prolyl cis-trans isomerase [Bacillus spongiae]|uniref:peptidylprolyl isomerase n=1 Tax=Bacillus spongiae TaxID=2683610 RepID=A0ABU8HJT1_9BACI
MNRGIEVFVACLLVTNMITLFFLLKTTDELASSEDEGVLASTEVVARIGDQTISREEWLVALENRYGQEVLEVLVDQKVMKEAGEKFNLSVSETEIEQELTFIQSIYNAYDKEWDDQVDLLREQIRSDLLLQKLLTKDVQIPEEELKRYYDENVHFYSIPDSFLLSIIVVEKIEEGNQVVKELREGSSFEALAMEQSIDPYSASQGGSLGYISKDSTMYSESFWDVVGKLKVGEWSESFPLNDGFAVIWVQEKREGKDYSFEEVKGKIHRQLALEQQESLFSPKTLYEEFQVKSFYDKESN